MGDDILWVIVFIDGLVYIVVYDLLGGNFVVEL